MFCKKGDFLYLEEGPILEVVYADEEKAVCLVITKNGGEWGYNRACVISNDSKEYKDKSWISKIDKPNITRKIKWAPIIGTHNYLFN